MFFIARVFHWIFMENYPSYQAIGYRSHDCRCWPMMVWGEWIVCSEEVQESPIPEQQFGERVWVCWVVMWSGQAAFIDETYRTKKQTASMRLWLVHSLGGNIAVYWFWYQDQIGCLGVFHLQTGSTKKPLLTAISRVQKLSLIAHLCRQKKQILQTKTLMDGNTKQTYIDSSLCYYHDLIAGGEYIWIILLLKSSVWCHP